MLHKDEHSYICVAFRGLYSEKMNSGDSVTQIYTELKNFKSFFPARK